MRLYAIHNGRRIAYWLGLLIGLDQFLGAVAPGADLDRTISHRLGVKRVEIALRRGAVSWSEVMIEEDVFRPWEAMSEPVRRRLAEVAIPFLRHPLAAALDRLLDRIDRNHSLKAIGA